MISQPEITAASFAEEICPPRIIGHETEYDVRDFPSGEIAKQPLDALIYSGAFQELGMQTLTTRDGVRRTWLSNGGVLYEDLSHLELGTAEGLGPREATAVQHGGNLLVARLVELSELPYRVVRSSATVDPATGVVVTKGYHPNFAIPNLDGYDARQGLRGVETHLITSLFAWGGIATKQGFNMSPKAFGVGAGIGVNTELNRVHPSLKPLGLVRHANSKGEDVNHYSHHLARFEDRSKTPSSQWSDFMGDATTSLILRVIEHPKLLRDENKALRKLELALPVQTFKEASFDLGMRRVYRLKNGQRYTALDIQEKLLGIVESAAAKLELPEDEKYGLEEWRAVLEDLRAVAEGRADIKTVASRIGWVGKYHFLRIKLGEGAVAAGSGDVLNYCRYWDMIAPQGLGQKYDAKAGTSPVTEDEIEQYVLTPPAGTRAKIRGESIAHRTSGEVSWRAIRKVRTTEVIFLHPYQTQLE